MYKIISIFLSFVLPICITSAFAKDNLSNSIQKIKSDQFSEVLITTKKRLLEQMGIYSSEKEGSESLVNFPVYPDSLMVVNKPYGMNYDDTLTLPFALFITENSLDEVVAFYKKKLNYYEMFRVGEKIVFAEKFIAGGKYPEDYYRVPNVSIHAKKLSNNKKGTMFSIIRQN